MTRILTIDVETSPHDGTFWELFKTTIHPDHIRIPTQVICYAAKWLDGKTYVRDWRDPDFVDLLWELLDAADVVITYNGDRFDLPHINREFARAGRLPVRPFASIDLYPVVKKNFKLPSNRLDYVCNYFLGEGKLDTGGLELWKQVMKGDEAAWRKMRRYNKRDTVLTERLYLFLRPWIRNHPYTGFVPDLGDSALDYTCPTCANVVVDVLRPRRTRCFAISVVRCTHCGATFDGKRKKL